MIKINHINGDEKVVTQGAFESIFKPLGYKLAVVENDKKVVKNELLGEKETTVSEAPKQTTKNNNKRK